MVMDSRDIDLGAPGKHALKGAGFMLGMAALQLETEGLVNTEGALFLNYL